MTDVPAFKSFGNPKHCPSKWGKQKRAFGAQIANVLSHLGISVSLVELHPVAKIPGSENSKGLHVRRVDPDKPYPAILFSFQWRGNNTCWEWRLHLPHGADAQGHFRRIRKLIEGNWHLTENAPPEDDSSADDSSQPAVTLAPAEVANDPLIAGSVLDAVFVTSRDVKVLSEGVPSTTALDAIAEVLGSGFPRGEGTNLLRLLGGRGWCERQHGKHRHFITKEGLEFLVGLEFDVPMEFLAHFDEEETEDSVDKDKEPNRQLLQPTEGVATMAAEPFAPGTTLAEDNVRRLIVNNDAHMSVFLFRLAQGALKPEGGERAAKKRFHILRDLGSALTARDEVQDPPKLAGIILNALLQREWVYQDGVDNRVWLTDKGEKLVESNALLGSGSAPASSAPAPVSPPARPATQPNGKVVPPPEPSPPAPASVAPPAPAARESVRDLKEKADLYDQATAFLSAYDEKRKALDEQIEELTRKRRELEEQQRAAQQLVESPGYKSASEELAAIRELLKN